MRTAQYFRHIASSLPEAARGLFDAALSGDAAAARLLIAATPRRLRGHVAVVAYETGVANPAYREIVGAVWRGDPMLLADFWPPAVVRRILARAEFALSGMAGAVRLDGGIAVYRGACGMPARKVAAGLCWYPSRSEAARLAVRRSGATGRPRLLRGIVKPADVIFWDEIGGAPGIVTRAPVAVSLWPPTPAAAGLSVGRLAASMQGGGWLPQSSRLLPAGRPDMLPQPQSAAGAAIGVGEGAEQHVHVM